MQRNASEKQRTRVSDSFGKAKELSGREQQPAPRSTAHGAEKAVQKSTQISPSGISPVECTRNKHPSSSGTS